MIESFWTPGRAVAVVELAAEGLAPREIGERMGCTRNAVIGRLYRQRRSNARKPESESTTIFDRLPDLELSGCRWIVGDVRAGRWSYCGEPVSEPGGSWCTKHRKRVFEKRRPNHEPME
jgi:GcrA cell cycle regulator